MTNSHDSPLARAEGVLDDAGTLTMSIIGELDIASVDEVRREMQPFFEKPADRVVFELGGLRFMDSSGIALLIQTANRFGTVEVRNPTPIVRKAIEVTGLTGVFGL